MERVAVIQIGAIALTLGIVTGILIHSIAVALAFLTISTISILFLKKSGFVPLFLLFVSVGILVGSIRITFVTQNHLPEGTFSEFRGVVSEYPDVQGDKVHYTVSASCFDLVCGTKQYRVLVQGERFPLYSYGDELVIRGKPHLVEGELGGYDSYLESQGFVASISFAKIEKVGSDKGNSLVSTLFRLRSFCSGLISDTLPQPESGLLQGMILGEKHALGTTVETEFKKAGLSHIVVLSGYNLMLVFALFFGIAQFITLRWAPLLAFTATALFVVLSGAEPASLRALGMTLLITLALLLRRNKSASHALALTVICFSLINPRTASSVSFLLSALATYGIVEWEPIISTFLGERVGWLGRFTGVVSETLSAQIIVSPLIVYISGSLPLFSLFSNILVIPFVPGAMLFGVFASTFILCGLPTFLVSLPALLLLKYILFITHTFSLLPSVTISAPATIVWFLSVLLVVYPLYKTFGTKNSFM